MNRQQSSSIKISKNYLTTKNNCVITSASSQLPNAQVEHILTSIEKEVWVTEHAPPQHAILDLQGLIDRPSAFNYVGFYCWYDYQTNPALIQICVKTGDSTAMWITVAKIRLEKKEGWQQFKIKEIQTKKAKFLKITIVENFGENNTYLNQISLGYVDLHQQSETQNKHPFPVANAREKSFSSMKLTSTQKQLKKANDRIRILESQQVKMKDGLIHQTQIIVKMQDNIQKLVKHIKGIQQNQEIQSNVLKELMKNGSNRLVHYEIPQEPERKRTQSSYQNEQISKKNDSKNKTIKGDYQKNKFNKKPEQTVQKYSYQDSDDDDPESISEYSQSPHQKSNYMSMLQKLQTLIAIREEKKVQLRSQKKSRYSVSGFGRDSDNSYQY